MIQEIGNEVQDLASRLRQDGRKFRPVSPVDEPAVESEPPDPDRTRDDSHFADQSMAQCVTAEPADRLYFPIQGDPVELKYFLDGTLSTVYWGDIYSPTRFTCPVLASNIVVAVIERVNKNPRKALLDKCIAVLLPFTESDPEWASFQNYSGSLFTPVPLQQPPSLADDLRAKLAGKGKSYLHEREAQVAMNLTRSEEWMVIDGDLRDSCFMSLSNIIGVAKSFSLKPYFIYSDIGKTFPVLDIIRTLPEGYRTPAFQHVHAYPNLYFWYMRLWSKDYLDSYLQGVIKVEVILGRRWENQNTDLINNISASLLREKFPGIYPNRRWHSHIYPVYLAETLAKSHLMNPYTLRQILFQKGV